MSKKQLCVVCQKPRSRVTLVTFIDADGVQHDGQPLCHSCRAGRSLWCERRHHYVVFIDGTAICPTCAERYAHYLYERKLDQLHQDWKELSALTPLADQEEFLKLVRKAINVDGAPLELCLASALVAAAYRFGVKVPQLTAQVKAQLQTGESLVTALLPSRDPAKRYKPIPQP